MSDDTQTWAGDPDLPTPPDPAAVATPSAEPFAPRVDDGGSGGVSAPGERPEIAVGAAFVGGFALALILKRLAR